MSYVDTNVLIAYINSDDALHNDAVELLDKILRDKYVSDLSIVELYSVFSRTMDLSDIEINALVKYTLRKTSVQRINVKWERVFKQAKEYANIFKLKSLDLLHLMVAIISNCSYFITFDKDILKRSKVIEEETNIKILG
ncbi:MAG: type II toxin-antitoxin system VapC family toxin [Staphylothermus sp.]|nr:type II toxin-antitoxin system VapC family toxin [Staphylothermus sp.]